MQESEDKGAPEGSKRAPASGTNMGWSPGGRNRASVLFISSYSPVAVGGVGQFILDLGRKLLEHGYGVGVCHREETREFDLPPQMDSVFIQEVPARGLRAVRTPLFLARTALAILKLRSRYDVCHLLVPQPMTAVAAILSKILNRKIIVTVFAAYPRSGRVLADILQRISEKLVFQLADEVTFECHATKRLFPKVEGVVILNGIDIGRYKPDAVRRAELRKALGLDEQAQVILYVGRVSVSKGIEDLLNAHERLSEILRHTTRIVFVGPIESSAQFLSQGKSLLGDKLILVGPVPKDQVSDYYQIGDIFVLPSYAEGISSSLIEAMACSLPAVVTNVGGNPEVVIDGVNGRIVQAGDTHGLTESLGYLLANPERRKRMAAAARNRIAEQFNLETMTGEYEEAYGRLTSRRR